MNVLPAITLYQPWATWIMRGWKTIETRTHDRFKCLNNRIILIHAGMTTDDSEAATDNPYLTREQIRQNPDEMINGYILGTARVFDTYPLCGIHSEDALIDCEKTNRYGLFLKEIDRFKEPIRAIGGMGIWYFDMDTHTKVKIMSVERGRKNEATIANGLVTPPQR